MVTKQNILVTLKLTDFSEVNLLVICATRIGTIEFINSLVDRNPIILDVVYGSVSDWELLELKDSLFTVFCTKPLLSEVIALYLSTIQ